MSTLREHLNSVSTETCYQCGYDQYGFFSYWSSGGEWDCCRRCGYAYTSRFLRNKDGTIKEKKNGRWAERYYERKGYGVACIHQAKREFSFIPFYKPISQKTIEEVKAEIAKGYGGYLTVWNEESKTADDVVGKVNDFWKNDKKCDS